MVSALIVTAFLAAVLVGCGGGGNLVQDGKAVVEAKCLSCHGISEPGEGGASALNKVLEGRLPDGMGANDSTIRNWLSKHDDKIGEKLTSAQIDSVLEYLKSIK